MKNIGTMFFTTDKEKIKRRMLVMVKKVDAALLSLLLVMTEQVQGTKDMWIKKWDLYFQVMGFSEFAAITGYTVTQFKEAYNIFTQKVQSYYDTFKCERGVQYSTLYAGVSLYGGLGFNWGIPSKVGDFEEFSDSMSWRYSHINALQGGYLPMNDKKKLEFKTVEEVMKGLIIMYYENREFFDRGTEGSRYAFFPQVDLKAALESV
ncbi:hypothetical protein NE562_03995 [Butyricicoccus faecihominis]|uniref:hypothetical protein n=1 Tax=Butyricicoccus faecihominis TaxID=1712515 RepID=UPI002478C6C8|nr:hypothetical protein [Butyricicoccus faecihominis]MCQ5128808.1 hypothetical protein [Butyricicoccus faecihominis]